MLRWKESCQYPFELHLFGKINRIVRFLNEIWNVFLTAIPLYRHVWRKYRNRRDSSSGLPWYRSVYSRDNTAESLHHRPHSGGTTTIQSATRILSAQDVSTLIYIYIYIRVLYCCRRYRRLAFTNFTHFRAVIFEGEDGQGLGQWTRDGRRGVSLTRFGNRWSEVRSGWRPMLISTSSVE